MDANPLSLKRRQFIGVMIASLGCARLRWIHPKPVVGQAYFEECDFIADMNLIGPMSAPRAIYYECGDPPPSVDGCTFINNRIVIVRNDGMWVQNKRSSWRGR